MDGSQNRTLNAETHGSGPAVNIYTPRESTWKHPAIYVAILAFLVAFWSEREARLAEYYGVDLEVFIAKQGLHPPPDPWRIYNPDVKPKPKPEERKS